MFRHILFAELPVSDQDRAVRFYAETLGLGVARDSPYQEGWRWIEMEIPGARTKILFARRADERPTETPSLVLIADDVRESFETLREKGIAFAQEPTEAPWNRAETFALFRDSENNTIMISSREGG